MDIMNFSKANCNNCYKCVRTCKVKAIKIVDNQAQIVPELCTACGHCLSVCPQNARKIHSDLDFIKISIKSGKKVNMSIAPSFRGFYQESEKFIWGLKKLGFNLVEETAVGADITSKLYRDYIKTSNENIFITTCCPSVVLHIEKYYPALISKLMPFTSPMVSHGYLLKERFPEEVTVFLGPCIAKKVESLAIGNTGAIDVVLTFDEVSKWMEEEGVDYKSGESIDVDRYGSNHGTSYPVVGGILEGIKDEIQEKNLTQLSVDGVEECKEIFEEIIRGNIKNTCVEVSACKKSCLGGPSGSNVDSTTFMRVQQLKEYLRKNNKKVELGELEVKKNFSSKFHNREFEEKIPTDLEIQEILLTMEKTKPEDYLNCGGCGYDTCREKAISIYRGMSHKEMCIHYMKKQTEKLSNDIFETSPNAILVLDDEYKILENNKSFSKYFDISSKDAREKSIKEFISQETYIMIMKNKGEVVRKVESLFDGELYMRISLIKMVSRNASLMFFTDITEEEKRKKKSRSIKETTFEATQTVIKKQMRIAQEIASLLGETTAETKVVLNRLKDVVEKEGEF